jgi:DNA processing protein
MKLAFDLDDPLLALAAWSRITEPGDLAAGQLLEMFPPNQALAAIVSDSKEAVNSLECWRQAVGSQAAEKALARWMPRLVQVDPERQLRALRALGGSLLGPQDAGWPQGLDNLGPGRPIALWVRAGDGVAATLGSRLQPAVAIVGTRASTAYGELVTGQFVRDFVAHGWSIVSGGAFGIDAAAHRAALAEGGFTVAIMAGGVDRPYPSGNERMLLQIASEGALISEVPPGSAPRRERFLSRNRLIAAMSLATVVTESSWRSGSHRTARVAAELMRAVGAVPGPVTTASSAGCHKLIREGVATLVTGADEVRELASPMGSVALFEPEVLAGPLDNLSSLERQVFDSMPARSAATLTALVLASGLSTAEVMAGLSQLERSGRAAHDGNSWRRTVRR